MDAESKHALGLIVTFEEMVETGFLVIPFLGRLTVVKLRQLARAFQIQLQPPFEPTKQGSKKNDPAIDYSSSWSAYVLESSLPTPSCV